MSDTPDTKFLNWPDRAYWRGFFWRMGLGLIATFGVFGAWLATMPAANRDAIFGFWARLRVPAPSFHLQPLLAAPVSVQVHVAAAVTALAVGAVIFLLPKGTGFHRFLGWGWVGSMIVVAAVVYAAFGRLDSTTMPTPHVIGTAEPSLQ